MADNAYSLSATSGETGDNANIICYTTTSTNTVLHLNAMMPNMGWSPAAIKWEVKGKEHIHDRKINVIPARTGDRRDIA